MAEVTEQHRILAHQVFMMGELHGQAELKTAIAQAIADAEDRGPQVHIPDPDAKPSVTE